MRYLNKGDKVRIISPAGYFGPWKKSPEIVKDMGFVPLMDEDLCVLDTKANILPFAHNYQYRAKSLIDALYEEDCQVIWTVCGGHGTPEMLNELRKLTPPKTPKLVIGFSDITALLLFLSQEWGWPTLHGPALRSFINSIDTKTGKVNHNAYQEMQDILSGKQNQIVFSNLRPLNQAAKQNIQLHGEVIGGNLALAQRSLGTFWQIHTKNKILVFEDINELARKVDAMLVQMDQVGLFAQAKAVIFADFNWEGADLKPNSTTDSETEDTNKIFAQFAQKHDLPVLRMSGIGHTKYNRPIFFHTPSQLNLGPVAELIVQTAGAKHA